jgi:hypothetical protein
MRKTLYIPKELLLAGYREEIFHLRKMVSEYGVRDAFSRTRQEALRLAEAIEVYEKISDSEDDILEVSYEAREGV